MAYTLGASPTRITSTSATIQWYTSSNAYWVGYKLTGDTYTEVYNDLTYQGTQAGYFQIEDLEPNTAYTITVKILLVDETVIETDYPTVSITTPAIGAIAASVQMKVLGNDTAFIHWETNIGINTLQYTINNGAAVDVPITAGYSTGEFYIDNVANEDLLDIVFSNTTISQTISLEIKILTAEGLNLNKDRTFPPIEVDLDNLLFPYIYFNPIEKARGKITAHEWNAIMTLLIHQGNYTAKALNELDLDILRSGAYASLIKALQLDLADDSANNVQAKLQYLKEQIDNLVIGAIPDNSITKAQLVQSFAETIPDNTDMGVLYLASKYHSTDNSASDEDEEYASPALTSLSHYGYTVTYANRDDESTVEDIYTMFGGDGTQWFVTHCTYGAERPGEIIIECPYYIRPTAWKIKMQVMDDTDYCPILYGSYDGVNYTQLRRMASSSSSAPTNPTTYYMTGQFTVLNYYKYFKLNFGSKSGMQSKPYSYIWNNMSFEGYSRNSPPSSYNTLSLTTTGNASHLSAYQTNQVVKIVTPETYIADPDLPATLNINNLGAKALPNDLEPNTRYSLIYDGEKFIKEA